MTRNSDAIWNRAAMLDGGSRPGPGDLALTRLLGLHSLAMSGGLLNAVESVSAEALSGAQDGYRFFGLNAVADVVGGVATALGQTDLTDEMLESLEQSGDVDYAALVPTDQLIVDHFEAMLAAEPDLFASE